MLRIGHASAKPTPQHALCHIQVARGLGDGNTPLLDQLYRLKLELAAEFSTLQPRPPIGWETLTRCPPNQQQLSRVTFEPGARTVWHSHPYDQILIATAGIGRFQLEGRPVLALNPGDSVTIASGGKHWHGAAPDQLFVHTSIQAADASGAQAVWLHPVSDAEYCSPTNAAENHV